MRRADAAKPSRRSGRISRGEGAVPGRRWEALSRRPQTRPSHLDGYLPPYLLLADCEREPSLRSTDIFLKPRARGEGELVAGRTDLGLLETLRASRRAPKLKGRTNQLVGSKRMPVIGDCRGEPRESHGTLFRKRPTKSSTPPFLV